LIAEHQHVIVLNTLLLPLKLLLLPPPPLLLPISTVKLCCS
jgi:hypothetical protein